MTQVVQGDAPSIVVNTAGRNGLEAWRKIRMHYEPETKGTARERLTARSNGSRGCSRRGCARVSFECEVAEYKLMLNCLT